MGIYTEMMADTKEAMTTDSPHEISSELSFEITSSESSVETTSSETGSLEGLSETSSSEVGQFLSAARPLLPGIIVMNHKYFLDLKNDAPKNGDMPFVMAIIKILQKADAFLGMILYKKTEQFFPKLTYTIINDVNCAVLPWNAKMYTPLLEDAITKASKHLAALAGSSARPVAIFYHQDERLLELQPLSIPFAITHHAPIVDDVARFFPEPVDILDAFGTETKSWQKVKELRELQSGGLETLKSRSNGFVLAMSELQGAYFKDAKVLPQNIINLPAPLKAMLSAHTSKDIYQALFGVDRKYFSFTAVARLTWFKNAELLVDGTIILLERGLDLSLLIAGGDGSAPHIKIRRNLLSRIPPKFRNQVNITERIPQEQLYAYFGSDRVQSTGIFGCCSRYETLGITPLEAALSGVTTVITNSEQIEATRYFPEEYRFEANAEALADRLEKLFAGDLKTSGRELKESIEDATDARGDFEVEFLKAWTRLSNLSF